MNDLQVFSFNEQPVRTVLVDGEPWWVLADVCKALDIKRTDSAARKLDEDEKGTHQVSTLRGFQQMIVVNESGLYSVILRSDKPEAKVFKRWVTHDVLPTIRKTGAYVAEPEKYIVPLAMQPKMSVEERLRRADLFLRAAEHKPRGSDKEERLVDYAVQDLLACNNLGGRTDA